MKKKGEKIAAAYCFDYRGGEKILWNIKGWVWLKNKREIVGIFLICAVMVSLAEMLWLGWVGATLGRWYTLGFMGAVCVT